ncbi:hypothetical protein QAD02_011526 [Eretmocerus hayati]|uniref:Uncharacterized protein n=1 Tax=Eretmocerus hayati TaxID=131215 RepID=A0ACC2NX17_9HYME|nr:hypothetical protein QAD02_011526 [Eretmocerus hayati]
MPRNRNRLNVCTACGKRAVNNYIRYGITDDNFATMAKEPEKKACYKMNHDHRGECHVFNHSFFNIPTLSSRPCADDEIRDVKNTFKRIGFNVIIHRDYNLIEIEQVLKKLSKKNYKNHDCICFFVMSHGEANGLAWARDKLYPVDCFLKTVSAVKTLAGKPKLLFTQKCRGSEVDKGIELEESLMGSSSSSSFENDKTINARKIPMRADTMVVHSTTEGLQNF